MHELPQDLANSVKSWRASIYGIHSLRKEPSDLEKGPDDHGEQDLEDALHAFESTVVLHPTKSRRALHHRAARESLRQAQPDSNNQTALAHRQGTLPPRLPAPVLKSVFGATPKVDDPDPAADRLDDDTTPLKPADFYELMGMKPPVSKQQNPRELAIKHGLYSRIEGRLSYVQTKYRIFDVLTYAFLALQLVLSATFIVLGSLSKVDSHVAIAVLGAVSTVVAGALALMKGQGLPNRLRQTRDSLRNVIFEAEELYWDVGAERQVYCRDIKKIREDFLRVTEEARRNHPDTWNATVTGIAQGVRMNTATKKPSWAPSGAPKL